MKSSIVRHPENAHFIRRWDWQVKALTSVSENVRSRGNEETGAEILDIMEYHYENRLQNRLLSELLEKSVLNNKFVLGLGDWLPYNSKYFQECLIGRNQIQIENAITLLLKLDFISINVPEEIPDHYNALNVRWFKLNVNKINIWIEENTTRSYSIDFEKRKVVELLTQSFTEGQPIPIKEIKAKAIPVKVETPKIETIKSEPVKESPTNLLEKQLNTLCVFHKHIFNKNGNTVYDKDRIKFIKDRMRLEQRTFNQCLQAIIGLTFSEWHMGANNENKVKDDIDFIFETNKQFERHLLAAETNGITEQIAYKELEGFLHGQPSKYMRVREKGSENASNEQVGVSQKAEIEQLSPELKKRYRDFANQVYSFFLNENVDVGYILQNCREDYLADYGKGLTYPDYLSICLKDKILIFKPELKENVKESIKMFSKTFCKLQELNNKRR